MKEIKHVKNNLENEHRKKTFILTNATQTQLEMLDSLFITILILSTNNIVQEK